MNLLLPKRYNFLKCTSFYIYSFLKDGIFETGAYRVPSKSQIPTILDQGGPFR
jgi:hypothetical protein